MSADSEACALYALQPPSRALDGALEPEPTEGQKQRCGGWFLRALLGDFDPSPGRMESAIWHCGLSAHPAESAPPLRAGG